ncbi:MAG: sigma-70 family RNA polymerase sigma factor [Alphaproteobacteria bacterium]|nr:sigma-70 family RNA polymerase sigma factor [Alphaproteobacteria bacterium]
MSRPTKSAYASSYASLTAEEECDFARRWLASGDAKAAERIVMAFQPLVRAQARRFVGRNMLLEDLVGEGNLGLMRALDKFDPERGVRFATYATWWIRAALLDHVLKNFSPLSISASETHKRLFFKLASLKNELAPNRSGPLPRELAELAAKRLDVPLSTLEEVDALISMPARSMDEPVGAADGSATLGELIADPGLDPESLTLFNHETADRRRLLKEALAVLSERERSIVAGRHLRDQPLKLEAFARLYGISRERVRQIEAAALVKLRTMISLAGKKRPVPVGAG